MNPISFLTLILTNRQTKESQMLISRSSADKSSIFSCLKCSASSGPTLFTEFNRGHSLEICKIWGELMAVIHISLNSLAVFTNRWLFRLSRTKWGSCVTCSPKRLRGDVGSNKCHKAPMNFSDIQPISGDSLGVTSGFGFTIYFLTHTLLWIGLST